MNETVFSELVSVDQWGIKVKNKKTEVFITFEECAKNYANEKLIEESKCVATRDITRLTFTFYTSPKIKLIFRKQFFKDILSGKTATGKFIDLQNEINKYGYTSYDLS